MISLFFWALSATILGIIFYNLMKEEDTNGK